jgi:cytochrome c peroxidase
MKNKSSCAVCHGNSGQGNSFHPFGAVNNGKNVITIITKLKRAHKINMKVGKPLLGEGDVERPGLDVAVSLALLAVQAGLGPGPHVSNQAAPHVPG